MLFNQLVQPIIMCNVGIWGRSPSAEQYILNSTSWNKRRIIAQLCYSCLPLEVELGHYRSPKTPMLERTCHLCNQEVGDESQFLLSCQEISTPRIELTEAMKKVIPNFSSLPLKEDMPNFTNMYNQP